MELANVTLTYNLVCVDRAASSAGVRKSFHDDVKKQFDDREGVSDEDKQKFAAQWSAMNDILADVVLTSSNVAVLINEAMSNMPLALMNKQYSDCIAAAASHEVYACDKLIAFDEMKAVLDELKRA
jgi:hypothetical protein